MARTEPADGGNGSANDYLADACLTYGIGTHPARLGRGVEQGAGEIERMYIAASLSDGLDFGMSGYIEARSDSLYAFANDLVVTHDERADGRVPTLPRYLRQFNAALHVNRRWLHHHTRSYLKQKVMLRKCFPIPLRLFGNPRIGTRPLMLPAPTAITGLPSKAREWQDSRGSAWLSYNHPEYLQHQDQLELRVGSVLKLR